MKKLAVTINLTLDVPEHWSLVQTPEGLDVLSIGDGQYLDLTFEPMVANEIDGEWTNAVTDEFMDDLLDMVYSEEVDMKMLTS